MASKEILTRLPGTSLRSVSHCILPPTRPILATAAKRWKSGLVKGTNPTCKMSKSDLQKEQIRLAKEQIWLAKGTNPTCKRSKSDLQKEKIWLANIGNQDLQSQCRQCPSNQRELWPSILSIVEISCAVLARNWVFVTEAAGTSYLSLKKREFVNLFDQFSLYISILEVLFRHCISSTIFS